MFIAVLRSTGSEHCPPIPPPSIPTRIGGISAEGFQLRSRPRLPSPVTTVGKHGSSQVDTEKEMQPSCLEQIATQTCTLPVVISKPVLLPQIIDRASTVTPNQNTLHLEPSLLLQNFLLSADKTTFPLSMV